jgi:trehalose 6-phosphate phosphatase
VADPDPVLRLAAEPRLSAILLDVDGTLAPIVADPAAAAVPAATRDELRRLNGRYALVACVSGRSAGDARRVVGVDELQYVGEHGLELDPEAERWAARLHEFAATVPWPDLERKPLTVSFHYRRAADRAAAREQLEAVAARAAGVGLVPRFGRMVLELRPPVAADKGTAVRHLLAARGIRRALYAGDDTTDLDAFRALDELELAVRVAIVTAESPPGLERAADVVLDGGPAALAALLRRL